MANWAPTAFPARQYEALIGELKGRGYQSVFLDEIVSQEPHMFLRHDVDICPERALEMAEREHGLDVCATYYFLLSTRFYNLASAQGRSVLRRIGNLGHQIGLHFDVTQYEGGIDEVEEHAVHECAILEMLIEQPVKSISFHRPAPELLNRPDCYAGRRHCYEPAFFSDIGYVSDSNGGWHHGHPLEHAAIADGTAIQLLTHPIWWTSEDGKDVRSLLDRVRLDRDSQLLGDLEATVKAYRGADTA